MQSPGLLLIIADNQENASLESAQQGWCRTIDMRETDDTSGAVVIAKKLLDATR